jgi:hypothetical protein
LAGLTSLAIAQNPNKIHDLKSLTDSSGIVHLFYRIYAEYEGTDYFTDNIYHYNTETAEEELFLEHYYDRRFGYESQFYTNEYAFFGNDPNKYIFIGNYDFEVGYIFRHDTLAYDQSFLLFPERLFVTGGDTSLVHVSFAGYGTYKSFDGGVTWPGEKEIREDSVPDSLELDFPLVSLSPYNDSLIFGSSTYFFQSSDAGFTYDTVEIYPNNEEIYYDSDGVHVYAMNTENCSSNTGCEYYLYRSSQKGAKGSWDKPKKFTKPKNISVNPSVSGELYIWGKDSIYVSRDYGESINLLYEIEEEITGVSVEGEKVFITTISSLYELENDKLNLLREIPVNMEVRDTDNPSTITLHQNYPNPFNPLTVIRFELPKSTQVSLKIYDVAGNLVQTLVSERAHTAGEHQYRWNADSFSSGLYFYRLTTSHEIFTQKMILIK